MNPSDPIVIVGGGQSGLAAARAVRDSGLRPIVLEAGDRPVGSWPDYYDSLSLFSPARYSAMPDRPFPGEDDSYPRRDEVVDYLANYAADLDVEIRVNTKVETVTAEGRGFAVHTCDGQAVPAAGVVAATGSFSNPHRPALAGQDEFTGELLHVASYREPKSYAGRRVVVVGGGDSAVQVAYELAEAASVTLATRAPLRFLPQQVNGRDQHYWLATTGFDLLPPAWLARILPGAVVMETGPFQQALRSGRMDRRPMFTGLAEDQVIWADGSSEHVDVVLLATGYRPSLFYLHDLGALDAAGRPLHSGGISATHPGLVYLGLEFQRSFSSNTLRGVGRDADFVIPALVAHATNAAAAVGI